MDEGEREWSCRGSKMDKARGRALSFQRFDACGDDLDGHNHSSHPENQRNEHISGLSFEQVGNLD
jgi:hypothetical protein